MFALTKICFNLDKSLRLLFRLAAAVGAGTRVRQRNFDWHIRLRCSWRWKSQQRKHLQYVIKNLRSSGFKRFFHILKASFTQSLDHRILLQASKIFLSSHLPTAKFEKPWSTSNYLELFSREWKFCIPTQAWKTQSSVNLTEIWIFHAWVFPFCIRNLWKMKDFHCETGKKTCFWVSRNCSPNPEYSALLWASCSPAATS